MYCLLLSRTQWKLWVNFLPQLHFFGSKQLAFLTRSLTTEVAVVLPVLSDWNQRNCAIVQTDLWDWDVMADRHVVIGLSLYIALVTSRFHLPNSDSGYSIVKPSLWTAVLSYRIFSIKVSCHHRVKNPAVKWTKRGSTMIRLTESAYVSCLACTESILLCGNIHPHPGPNNPERLSIGTNVNSDKPMPARITYSARQLLSFNFQHDAHVISDLALACIQQAGILHGSTNHIVTPSRIQVHVTESCLRCLPRQLNHANLANCINLSPMADYANNQTRFLCSPETHHSRQSIVTLLSRNSAVRPSASFIRRGEDRSKRCHLRSIPLSRHVKKKGCNLLSFNLANACLLKRSWRAYCPATIYWYGYCSHHWVMV